GLSPVQRLLAVWATVAILTVAFATRREAGQLLIVLLPFSLIAASLVQEVVSKTEWGVLKSWWPALALVLALGAYVALQLSNWSSADAANPFTGRDKAYAWLALFAAGGSIAVGMSYLQRNAAALALPVAAALAVPFLVHSSLSLGLRDGAEFAAGERATTAVAPLRAAVAAVAAEAGRPATIDAALSDTLGWHLRDLGVALGDPEAGSLFVTVAGRPPPAGYEPLGGPWRISEGWTLDDFGPIRTWRWFVYRRGFGSLSAVDAQILVPTQ
ncbi:MAG TPA: hypothetical protein VFX28_17205, partial [Methylomirabilota bacterium]|nr:hypothetical protein [Methylomirabilota bacterium]